MLNFNFFKKNNFKNFISKQLLTLLILYTLAIYLVKKNISILNTILYISGLFFYSYFLHIIVHFIPEKLNPHMIHHSNLKLNKFSILPIECFLNIFFFLGLYFFQKIINYKIFPDILILYYGIIYVSIHIINYSIIGDKNHEKHHNPKNKKYYNYGPDTIDHLMNTNYDDNYENLLHILPNIVVSFIISNYLYNK